ncbi:MAG: uroporphyrinogen decarboxylase [Methanobacteriota archaeon]
MNDRILRALAKKEVDATPVWFMRQAGRYLPEYKARRKERGILELAQDPEAAAEITMLPVERFPIDAAVLFSDLSLPLIAAGFQVEIQDMAGPVVATPVRTPADVARLRPFDVEDTLGYVLDEIRILRSKLSVPLVGFVGAPFTLVSYLIEGGRSRNLEDTKRLMLTEPAAWDRLLSYWTEHLGNLAIAEHRAGAAVIQVFDSWAGHLGVDDYAAQVLPHSQALLSRLRDEGVPTIHFAVGNPRLLPLLAEAGGDAVSVDWRVPLDDAWAAIGKHRAIQGNLDPVALLAGRDVAVRKTREVLRRAAGRPGHIFNLGHGMLPATDPGVVAAVVDAVHDYGNPEAGSRKQGAGSGEPGG